MSVLFVGRKHSGINTKSRRNIHAVPTVAQIWKVNTMADETGIVLPWEKDAMAGMEMPDGLSYPDQILYLGLRMLYRQYYQKIIGRETAVREKKKMIEQYKDLKFREKMGYSPREYLKLSQ